MIAATRYGWLVAGLTTLAGIAGGQQSQPQDVSSALSRFRLPAGFTIECVASEPAVIDPVAVRFDARGRMWVVEMGDYPLGPQPGEPGRSRVKILEDADQDGVYEKVTVFADQLLFATGVLPWRDGALVTMAGKVVFFRDADQDGRSDEQTTWFHGFAEQNSQLRANHPRLGPDGWIYVANGLRGGVVVDARHPNAPEVSISGMDFRFDPHGDAYEAASGVGQFGLTFDRFGNRFVCSNRNPVIQIVLENRDVRRQPAVALDRVSDDVAAAGEASRIYPISRAWTTSNLHAGQFTAACGVTVFLGDGLGDDYRDSVFICDPTGNLVHAEHRQISGATFVSQPDRQGVEFLASDDEWFRPVNLENGPDGSLYVVDMYRAVIEHPQFMPAELKQRSDLTDGNDRGRIYRVRHRHHPAERPGPLGTSPTDWLKSLNSIDSWQATMAAQLLWENLAEIPEKPLRETAINASQATARFQAAHLLSAREQLDETTLLALSNDPHIEVRRAAVRLSADRWQQHEKLSARLIELARDPATTPIVRLQVALAWAGHSAPPEALASLALPAADDPWVRRSVRLAAGRNASTVVTQLWRTLQDRRAVNDGERELVRALTKQAIRIGELPAVAGMVDHVSRNSSHDPHLWFGFWQTCLDGLAARRWSLAQLDEQQAAPAEHNLSHRLPGVVYQPARELLQHENHTALPAAFAVLAHDDQSVEVLAQWSLSDHTPDQRVLAIRALTRQQQPRVWRELLERFAVESPIVRQAIIDGLLARQSRTELLLRKIEDGELRMNELDAVRLQRLTRHKDPQVRAWVKRLVAQTTDPDRQAVLARYASAVSQGGNPDRGRDVFRRQCATCHRIGDLGAPVGPDISDSRTKTSLQILNDVLIPNQAIDNNYLSYAIETNDGRLLSGIVATETPTSVTLNQPDNKTVVLGRNEIAVMQTNGQSLMPSGLEQNIPIDEMADLIAFVKNWRYLDGKTPLGKPGGK